MCGRYEFCFKRNIDDPVISEEQAASITQRSNNEVFFLLDHVLAFIGRHGSIQALCMQWGFSLKKQRIINARLVDTSGKTAFS